MQKNRTAQLAVLAVLIALALSVPAWGVNFSPYQQHKDTKLEPNFMVSGERDDYTGRLRLYMVQPVYVFKDHDGHPYEFGFLDFALDSAITLPDSTRYYRSVNWHSNGISEDNIMVMAVVFTSEKVLSFADPPSGSPFWAYYSDAAAGAIPGMSDSNKTTPTSTHTVFVEEGTATW